MQRELDLFQIESLQNKLFNIYLIKIIQRQKFEQKKTATFYKIAALELVDGFEPTTC